MELNLATLSNEEVYYDEDFSVDEELYKSVGILDLKNCHVVGSIFLNSASMLNVNLTVTGVMVLPDSVTTEPIDYPFTSKIEEKFDINDEITTTKIVLILNINFKYLKCLLIDNILNFFFLYLKLIII